MLWQIILGFYVAAGISLIAWWRKALDLSGAIGATVVGTIIFGLGGWGPSIALVLFFISGSVLSGLPSKLPRASLVELKEKHGRSWKQVAANGIVPMAAILASVIVPSQRLLFTYIFYGAVATSCSDTWGTEIGVRYGKSALDILTGRGLDTGLSGGVSVEGFAASIAGSALIALASFVPNGFDPKGFFAILVAGILGSLSDSVLGSAMQGKYRAEIEGGTVRERHSHPGMLTPQLVQGFHVLTNNGVNCISSVFGAFMTLFILK